jgi:hypothetical protein
VNYKSEKKLWDMKNGVKYKYAKDIYRCKGDTEKWGHINQEGIKKARIKTQNTGKNRKARRQRKWNRGKADKERTKKARKYELWWINKSEWGTGKAGSMRTRRLSLMADLYITQGHWHKRGAYYFFMLNLNFRAHFRMAPPESSCAGKTKGRCRTYA